MLKPEDKIVGVEVSQIFPDINESGKVIKYDTVHVKIYQQKNFQMFKIPYLFEQWNEDTLTFSEERHHYLFYEEGAVYGYDFDLSKSDSFRRVNMDSVRKREGIFSNNLYESLVNTAILSQATKKDAHNRVLSEFYELRQKEDTSSVGVCQFTYDQDFNDIRFSLSKELDSIKNAKLIEAVIISKPRYYKGVHLDEIRLEYLIRRLSKGEVDDARSQFRRFLERRK